MPGKVEYIFIASNEGEPMKEVQEVRAIERVGLEGDRYAGERGAFSKSGRKVIRHVSLITLEAIERAAKGLADPFLPKDTRRNIVVSGFTLNRFVEAWFTVGPVRMRGVELCDPCQRPSKLSGKSGFESLFYNSGGLRAEILNEGIIRVGDEIKSATTFTCNLCGTTTSYPHVCRFFYPGSKR